MCECVRMCVFIDWYQRWLEYDKLFIFFVLIFIFAAKDKTKFRTKLMTLKIENMRKMRLHLVSSKTLNIVVRTVAETGEQRAEVMLVSRIGHLEMVSPEMCITSCSTWFM